MNWREVIVLYRASTKGEPVFRRLFGITAGTKRRGKAVQALLLLSMLAAFASMFFFLGLNYLQMETIGKLVGIEGLSWFVGSLAAGTVTFLFGLFSSSSVLYHGKDLPLVMTMPVKESQVFASRLLLHYRIHITLHTYLFFPAQAVFLWQNGITGYGIVSLLFQALLLPFVPVSLSLLAIHLSMRSARSGGRGRESWAVGIMVLLFIVVQGLASRWLQSGLDTSSLQRFADAYGFLFKRMQSIFLFNTWMSALARGIGVWKHLLAGTAVIIASIALALLVIRRDYADTVRRLSETTRKRAGASNGKPAIGMAKGMLGVLVSREFSMINAHSAFRMELYAEAVIPLILVVVYAISGTLQEISQVMESVSTLPAFPFIITGVLLLMASFSMMSSTSFSREGSLLAASRLFPVQPTTFVQAKLIAHLSLYFGSFTVFSIAAVFLLHISPAHLVWMLPLGCCVTTSSACLGLAIDARQPRLDWQLPQQAVKQNVNGLVAMGLSLIQLILIGAFALLCLEVADMGGLLTGTCLVAVAVALAYISWRSAVTQAVRLYGPQ